MFHNYYAATMSKRKKLDNFHLYSFVSLHFSWNSNTVVITVPEEGKRRRQQNPARIWDKIGKKEI